MDAIEALLVKMAIGFALKQLEEFAAHTNWVLVKNDCYVRVKQLIPNAIADTMLDASIGVLIDTLAAACKEDSILQEILSLMTAGKINQAVGLVQDLCAPKPAAF